MRFPRSLMVWAGLTAGLGLALTAFACVRYPVMGEPKTLGPMFVALALSIPPGVALLVALGGSLHAEKKQKELAEQNAALAEDLSTQTAQLRDAQAVLQDAIDARTQMIQNVSHELRTPLATISGYTEALQAGLCGQDEAIEVIQSSSQKMMRLVDDLLTVQALDRAQLELSPVSLPHLLRRVAASFAQRALAAGVAIRIACDERLPELYADETRIEQVLSNLIDNAIKFSPGGGEVLLRATTAVETGAASAAAEISVEDHGIGIPPEELPRIYRRFYQVNGTRSRRFGGQGLGLAIARRIVEIHGGSIRAESEVGKGTKFFVSLPVSPPVPASGPAVD